MSATFVCVKMRKWAFQFQKLPRVIPNTFIGVGDHLPDLPQHGPRCAGGTRPRIWDLPALKPPVDMACVRAWISLAGSFRDLALH